MTNYFFDSILRVLRSIFDTRTEEERYLANSVDVCDLERRMREIQRGDFHRRVYPNL